MRVFIECDDLVGVLLVVDPARSASHTFGKRISLIEGVSSVSIEDASDPHLPRRDRVVPSRDGCCAELEG